MDHMDRTKNARIDQTVFESLDGGTIIIFSNFDFCASPLRGSDEVVSLCQSGRNRSLGKQAYSSFQTSLRNDSVQMARRRCNRDDRKINSTLVEQFIKIL